MTAVTAAPDDSFVRPLFVKQSAFTLTRSSADAEKPARRDPEGGKVSATGWPPIAVSYAEGVNVSAGRAVVQHCHLIAQRYKTENFLSPPE